MNQTDRWRFRIDNVNRAAVGDVNAQRDTRLIGDDAVAAGKMLVLAADTAAATLCKIDNCDFISMNLLGREQRPIAHADCIANSAMRGIKPLQYFGFIMGNVDVGNSLRENVTTDLDRAQRRKLFERQIHHLSLTSREAPTPSCHVERS